MARDDCSAAFPGADPDTLWWRHSVWPPADGEPGSGFVVYFDRDDTFVGWLLDAPIDGADLATPEGVTASSTLGDLLALEGVSMGSPEPAYWDDRTQLWEGATVSGVRVEVTDEGLGDASEPWRLTAGTAYECGE